jgi:hypothetical protein
LLNPAVLPRVERAVHLNRKGESMRRIIVTTVATGAVIFALSASASAFQCPKLVKQIEDEAGQRFDDAAYAAKQSADQATALHKEGKHAEAEAKAKEGLARLGMAK